MITRVSRDDPSFGRWLESGPKPGAEQGRPKTWRALLVRSRRHGVNDIDLLPNLSSRRDKHHRRPTASSGDDGIVLAGIRSYPVAEPPKMAGICIQGRFQMDKPPNPAKCPSMATSPESRRVNASKEVPRW